MTTPIDFNSWLSVLCKEYLQDFIKSGGAGVKFAVSLDNLANNTVLEEVKKAAEEDGYLFVSIDAVTTKAHMIDKVFHAIAGQVDWDDLTYAFLCTILAQEHYQLPGEGQELNMTNLASLNNQSEANMKLRMEGHLRDHIYKDYTMTQQFRIAMLRLCQAQLEPQKPIAEFAPIVKEWLRGELRLISAIKPAFIFSKLGRHNARHMLFSLASWVHNAGKSGLVISLDISRFMESTRPLDGSIYYTRNMLFDGYEVLRQFIDGTDELKFCLILVFAPPSFLSPEKERGLQIYEALYFRIWDEVRDKQRTNPLSCLIRLSDKGQMKEIAEPGDAQ